MRLTRLEIFGFKSFVDRFVLDFNRDLIGIIGPNGCGKSNIVDSLRWILGETHARQLRGKLFDDLIFNGSESRRALGLAEVSITIRPSEGWADNIALDELSLSDEQDTETAQIANDEIEEVAAAESDSEQIIPEQNELPRKLNEIPGVFDAAEIQLTRRLYRSGESEFYINRVPCRLRDMVDLYRLIGLGSRGLNIVQQGTVGEIVTKKPVERRELLEEAAGISGFRSRIEAAQRRLEKTSENMARVSDILIEVEKQVRVLKRQASRAKNRQELKVSLKEADSALFSARAAKLSLDKKEEAKRYQEIELSLEQQRAQLNKFLAEQEDIQANLQTYDVELVELRDKRRAQTELLNREKDQVQELELQLVSIDTKLVSLLENLDKLAEKKINLESSSSAEKQILKNTSEKIGEIVADKERADSVLSKIISERPKDASSEASELLSELRGDISNIDSLIEIAKENSGDSQTLLAKLKVSVVELKSALASKLERLSLLYTSEKKQRELEIEASRAREREAQRDAQNCQEALLSLNSQISRAEERLEFFQNQLIAIDQESHNSQSARHELEQRRKQLKEQLKSLSEASSEDEEHTKNVIKLLNDTESKILAIEDSRSSAQRSLAKVAQDAAELRRAVDQLQSEGSDKKLLLEKSNIELSMLKDEFWRLYSETFETPSSDQIENILTVAENDLTAHLKSLAEECDALRRKLEREGEVDPQSIELYEVEQKRFDDLSSQYSDLKDASEILLETIKRLKEISRQKFLQTFDSVKGKFSELIPRLFGGGAGSLELVNPDDPLESGVELNVRLPGKKVRSMELLSGGEKALVATALIIAMFLHRPSPICVLDEVDAPLDDANLERFLSLVKEISSSTQILIITHNKLTMSAANRLIGITMQESGVSTALSVSVEEVERDLDKWVANA